MTNFRGRLLWLSFFMFAAVLFGGLSAYATESCAHDYVEVESHPATCTSKGGTTYQCTECSHTFIRDTAEMLDHKWETVSETAPTCTASGAITRRCTVCNTEQIDSNGEATGHIHTKTSTKEPTCSEEGYSYSTCDVCGLVVIDEDSYTDKIEHTYQKQIITDPTCQQEGYAEYTCTICQTSYREQIAIVDHDRTEEVTPPTHTAQGYTTFTCRFCGETKRDEFTEPIPYDMEYTVEEPTCTENGQKVGVCRDGCLHTVNETLPALGHDFGENEGWTVVRQASETLDGLEQRVCLHCALTESRSIPFVAPEPEPAPTLSPALLICIIFAIVLFLGVMVVVLLMILERAGHKNTRKYALLTAVDKALAEDSEAR